MQQPPTLQTGYSGYGRSLATSLALGVAGCATVVVALAFIVFVREVITEPDAAVPEPLTVVLEEPPKKTKVPVASGPERVITVPTGPALVRMEPTETLQKRPELVEIPEVEQPEPDLLVFEEFEDHPFEEEKEVTEPVEKPPVVVAETSPAKRQGPTQAELDRREAQRIASLEKKISKSATLVSAAKPVYPKSALRQGLEGRVVIAFTVASNGNVTNCRVSRSSGHSVLDQAALQALKRYRFQPARNGLGQAVSVQLERPFNFVTG